MSKKKYLFIIRSLTGGGAERVVSVLANHLARDGYNVEILVYSRSEHDYGIDSRVTIRVMPSGRHGFIGKMLRITDMRSILRKASPDVIIPFVGTILPVSYFASIGLQIPFIRTIRISPWQEEGSVIQKIFRHHLNNKAAAIMVQNDEQVDFFSQKLQKKIFVVPNPVDDKFILAKKEYRKSITRLVNIGRLTNQKNQEELIRVFDECIPIQSEIKLDIYGTGPEHNRLRELISSLKRDHQVFLKGRSDNMVDILRNSDLFIFPSKFEGMPNALMEAMAVGVPCISSDCPTGPSTLIDNECNGILYNNKDHSNLVQVFSQALDNPVKMNSLGVVAKETIRKNYSYESVYERMVELLDAVTDKK